MSTEKNRRVKQRIDYKLFSETGIKISKESEVMASHKIINEEKKVCFKLNRFVEENEFELLFETDDIEAAISECRKLQDDFEEIHLELQNDLGDEYEKVYKDFITNTKRMTDWIKTAKLEIKRRKVEKLQQEKDERVRKEEQEEQLRREEKEERLRKEREEKEERLRKEREEKDERVTKEEQEERFRKEKEEKEGRLRREYEEREDRERQILEKDKEEKLRKEKEKLINEEKYFRRRIHQEIEDIKLEGSTFVDDIQRNIITIKELSRGYSELNIRIENMFDNDYSSEYAEIYDEQNRYMNKFIQFLTSKVQEKRFAETTFIKENEEELNKQINKEKINLFHGIFENIKERGLLLKKKCKVSVSSLSDSDILQSAKDAKGLDAEFNEFLNWIIELIKVTPSNYDKADEILTIVSNAKNVLKILKSKFQNDLNQEILNRDISEEKLKNASVLRINVPKYCGYGSTLDFYTFKTEFEKLISPHIQAKLLPEYLKNNFLEGQAFELVKEIDLIDEIWERLKTSFGDVTFLLNNKLSEVVRNGPLWKNKNEEKLIQQTTKLINGMKELNKMAEKHNIEESLFHQCNFKKIYDLIGTGRMIEFTKQNIDKNLTIKQKWEKMIDFLQKDVRVKEEILMNKKFEVEKNEERSENKRKIYVNAGSSLNTIKCQICSKTDHVVNMTKRGKPVVNYFACPKFVEMQPLARLTELKSKGLCFQCLNPSLKKGHDGFCFNKFNCPHASHKKFDIGYHILVCDAHKNEPKNQELLEEYKAKHITTPSSKHKDFSKNIAISFYADSEMSTTFGAQKDSSSDETYIDHAIYMLQTIEVQGKTFNLFFDSGCGDLVCKKEAITRLECMGRVNKILDGPLTISGVGDNKTISKHGVYEVKIPLYNGKNANLCGVCLDRITGDFPIYPLKEVEKDIHSEYGASKNGPKLPKLPYSVGGETDLMIGIQYLKYYPKRIFSLPNGLTIYESQFLNSDGSRGLVGGPHRVFTEIHKKLRVNHSSLSAYLTEIVKTYKNGFQLSIDVPLLGLKNVESESESEKSESESDLNNSNCFASKRPRVLKRFDEVELAGTEISYRCVRCRGCTDCKNSKKIECISIQEEVEQTIIDHSVTVNIKLGYTSARLPFLCDPTKKLPPNRHIATRIYEGQVKKLSRSVNDKKDVIMSERKLQELGFVEFMEDLTIEQQNKIINSPVNYFIPWRSVWNMNSVSTQCRLVFDASQATSSGVSLNCLLAKGRNNMNRLVQLGIRWQIRRYAFHTDVRKMYNSLRLHEDHWCYQLYLWDNELSQHREPKVKVIKTLIYGVKSSGNQAERGIRETGNLMKEEYPRQNEIIRDEIYVDDCMSGEDSYDDVCKTTDSLKVVLNKGGFNLKGFTFSGFDPPEHLSNEDKSINVGGMKWYSKSDLLSLNIGELNFEKKCRGKKAAACEGLIPEKFTRRDCAGKVAEIFDLLGKFTPITAGLKLDLSELCKRNLDWDDYVPDNLKDTWKTNFELIRKMGQMKFRRAVVPEDAISLDIETIEMADASQNLACAAIYVRFKRKSGEFSCQLIFSRSKLIPKDMTMPRAELFAASLNVTTGYVVYSALEKYVKFRIHLTDSQIVLFWVNNTKSQMKQWVRNRVIEINRLTNRENWFYIESANMSADLGTRKGVKLENIAENSSWINGHNWAKKERKDFPIKSLNDIKLSNDDVKNYKDESLVLNDDWISKQLAIDYSQSYPALNQGTRLNNISERYKFSLYVMDPNKFRFRKVVRILALVILFIKNLKTKVKGSCDSTTCFFNKLPKQFENFNDKYLVTQGKNSTDTFPFNCTKGLVVTLTNEILMTSLNYFYKKATLEIKKFLPRNAYKNISKEKDCILYYIGRILPSQEFDGKLNLSDVCIDLTSSSFCVPLVDKFSPLAYAVVNEVHWYSTDVRHSGNESVLRYVQKIAFVLEGRSIVKKFRKQCPRCKILIKKAIDVAMGPLSANNLCIAPAFFISQVDIFGPFHSYSNINKRATSKIWFVIFCCCTTGAINLKIMEDYSTDSFVLAFVRFSCQVGFPKKLLPDAGSQLIKGCQTMVLKFSDIKHKLHVEFGVLFETCPVGAHYMHGKVERKIRHVQESFSKCNENNRLSIIQWETLGTQVANSINNMPIALGNVVQDLENLDILTPNRLMLGRNNDRCPMGAITVSSDVKKIIQTNAKKFETWFKCWLISYVPNLMSQPKWFDSDRDSKVGDVVLFLKSEKEFDKQYQYGVITTVKVSKDGKIREVEIEYQNHNENIKRHTNRGAREIVIIHPVDELDIMEELSTVSQ